MACLSKFWIGKRQGLELPLSEEEIFSAWSDLNGGKAPGRIFGAFLVSIFALETAIRFCLTNCRQSGFHPFMKGNFLLKVVFFFIKYYS